MRSAIATVALTVVAAMGAGPGSSVRAQGVAEKEVLQVQSERFRASVAKDAKSLDRIFADEIWYCRPSGYCENKEQLLKLLTAAALPGARFVSMKPVGNMKATVYGDTAMVTGRFDQDFEGTGGTRSLSE